MIGRLQKKEDKSYFTTYKCTLGLKMAMGSGDLGKSSASDMQEKEKKSLPYLGSNECTHRGAIREEKTKPDF